MAFTALWYFFGALLPGPAAALISENWYIDCTYNGWVPQPA
jgi:hypothetical protein